MRCGALWAQKNPIWLWWGIERGTHQIVAWALGDRGKPTAQLLGPQLPAGEHIRFCTDHHRPYLALLAGRDHQVGKAHTHHIESMNNKLRCYLARLRRKTHSYSRVCRRWCIRCCLCGGGNLGLRCSRKRAA